jgi:hypothetical protein
MRARAGHVSAGVDRTRHSVSGHREPLGDDILAARGPAAVAASAVAAVRDDSVCETAARAAAQYWDNPTRLAPRQLRPVLVFHIGTIWFVGEPGHEAQGYCDDSWRLVEWYGGPP